MDKTVGIIGLGIMGGAIARNLIERGWKVVGFDTDAGLTTPNLAEAETNRSLIRVARRVVVLADHTKWNLVSLSSFARLSEADVLITDDMLPGDARSQVAEQVGEIVYAESMLAGHVSKKSA